jgi:hypothetical protein
LRILEIEEKRLVGSKNLNCFDHEYRKLVNDPSFMFKELGAEHPDLLFSAMLSALSLVLPPEPQPTLFSTLLPDSRKGYSLPAPAPASMVDIMCPSLLS